MVEEFEYNGPRNVALDTFEEVAEDSEGLETSKWRRNAYLKEKTSEGGLISSPSYEEKISGHPTTSLFEVTEPTYFISVFDGEYMDLGRETAERIEEEFDIEVYLFERE